MREIELKRKIDGMVEDLFEFAHDKNHCGFGKGEFAKICKMSASALYKLRSKRTKDPRYSTILKIADALGFNPQIKPSDVAGWPHNTSAGQNLRAKIIKIRRIS